ncbi:MAG: hypothetical protein RL375_4308 [Pseudomonadota bacterium]|jgi:lambda family phage minor tail protein L
MAGLYVDAGYVQSGYIEGASIYAQLHKLNGGAWVDLFELDLTPLGGALVRFHAGTNKLRTAVVWQGNTYQPFPIQAEGFDFIGSGELPRPKLRVANVSGIISALVKEYDDLIGMKLTRKRTMVQYLDEVNFEEARNILGNTNTPAGTGWTVNAATVTQNFALSIDGNTAAARFTPTAVASSHTFQQIRGPVTAGQVVYSSIYVKSQGARYFVLQHGASGAFSSGSNDVRIDLNTGQQIAGQAGTPLLRQAIKISDGWWRIVLAATATATGNVQFICYSSLTTSFSSAGDGTSSVLLWGPQSEVGGLTDYQAVTGSSYVRNPTADPYSFLPDEIYTINQKKSEDRLMVEF